MYYLFQIGTLPNACRRGYCTLLLRHFQQLVVKEGQNNLIWLEATSEAAVKLYKKEGWAIVDEMVIGKGKCDIDGKDKKNGDGFKLWVMVWWPAMDAL
jgi:ribosomal protein S18 acetylase RimI-like enzyme